VLAKVQVRTEQDVAAMEEQRRRARAMQFQHAEAPDATAAPQSEPPVPAAAPARQAAPAPTQPVAPFVREDRKVGRNEPCPCGSGLKYKQCHGRLV
jgi:preprotein translocase subunit SecA